MTFELEPLDIEKDYEFSKAMHGSDAKSKHGICALFNKNRDAQKVAFDSYFGFWGDKYLDKKDGVHQQNRFKGYATLTRHYYNLVTDLYEYGWSPSFHFCRFSRGESFSKAIARHEHYLASHAGIREGETVLDIGSGVGGPALEISVFTGANIVGINNNDYQIERAQFYAQKKGLSDKLSFVKGDFMQMPFSDNYFDKVYSIEATVHAPSLEGVYGEAFRVLKPGGIFALYEWVLLDKYDETNPEHRKIVYGIEIGDSIPKMFKVSESEAALRKVGFEIIHSEELSTKNNEIPWYYLLDTDFRKVRSLWDLFSIARMTWLGRWFIGFFLNLMEFIGVAPKGCKKVNDVLLLAADALVDAGKQQIFSPMQMWVCRKPLV
ncbi:sterol 24-C-methyltransferase [Pneumocystis jirovecii RU7]|uniref:Sterol 24-C-methyltransferase n=1 Tax=Pneumocystis jirovecii (strain RU7) TaxID=1408657 RepID=A0A0W4ZK15_PNEJ7|nr:sterol 24-C-methyltransferase [Pneumocystis jirovecii RU7]KTW28703.1 sterol 24-C-methyltransferase [Pneumocystis jirovecii RU7]